MLIKYRESFFKVTPRVLKPTLFLYSNVGPFPAKIKYILLQNKWYICIYKSVGLFWLNLLHFSFFPAFKLNTINYLLSTTVTFV